MYEISDRKFIYMSEIKATWLLENDNLLIGGKKSAFEVYAVLPFAVLETQVEYSE